MTGCGHPETPVGSEWTISHTVYHTLGRNANSNVRRKSPSVKETKLQPQGSQGFTFFYTGYRIDDRLPFANLHHLVLNEEHTMIITVTLNPALDKTVILPGFASTAANLRFSRSIASARRNRGGRISTAPWSASHRPRPPRGSSTTNFFLRAGVSIQWQSSRPERRLSESTAT